MKKSKILFVSSLCAVVLAACGGARYLSQHYENLTPEQEVHHISMDFIVFESFDEMQEWTTTYVIRAIGLSSRVEIFDTQMSPYGGPHWPFTFTAIEVLEVFSGNLEVGDIRYIWQMGGEDGHITALVHGKKEIPLGEELILFVTPDASHPDTPLSLVSMRQAVYRMELNIENHEHRGEGEYFGIMQAFDENLLDEGIVLESLNEQNNLTLTIGELMRIAEAAGNKQN